MIRQQAANPLDANQMKTIRGLSGTMAQAGMPVSPSIGGFGSGIRMPGASPSSQAIASFANLAPQQPGAPAFNGQPSQPGGIQPPAPLYGSTPGSLPPTAPLGGTPSAINPYAGGSGKVPYSQAAIDAGMTVGDIWSNPAFANAMAASGGKLI